VRLSLRLLIFCLPRRPRAAVKHHESRRIQVSPATGQAADRAALRLSPPMIPMGWPWVDDASRPSRRRKTATTKATRTTK